MSYQDMNRILLYMIAAILLISCGGSKKITGNGLKYVRIGDPMLEEGLDKLKGRAVRDTIFNENGYIWRASILKYKTGKVYIEEDFFEKHTVNRIRVETPDLVSRKTITVGMNFSDLQSLGDDWEITYLESYGVFDVASIDYPSVHYLVKASDSSQTQPGADAKIISIVIM
jgi:hypothetical protein